jgi:hypothetical protein
MRNLVIVAALGLALALVAGPEVAMAVHPSTVLVDGSCTVGNC